MGNHHEPSDGRWYGLCVAIVLAVAIIVLVFLLPIHL